MQRNLKWYDPITISIHYTGLTTISQTLTPLVIPLLIQQFVGVERQATYYGTIRLWSLMVALLVQSLMGTISDRSKSRWGRRRPFMLVGAIITLLLMFAIGITAGFEDQRGFWSLFILVMLLMISANTAHAAVQGLIPDLVPREKRGIYSGVKSILEVPLPLMIIPYTIGSTIASGDIIRGIAIACAILTLTTIISMFAPETQFTEPVAPRIGNLLHAFL